MKPDAAWELGFRSADAGFFFDAMEIIAAVSPATPGGIDGLRGAVELLFAERSAVNDHMDWVAALVSAAFSVPVPPPRTVDAYRAMLTSGVFEIVNRWSLIADIRRVNQLQAWFYGGFGLGRGATALRGMRLAERLYGLVGTGTAADQMPDSLQRMAAEAAKQIEVASKEDDLRGVEPLLSDAAGRMKRAAVTLLRPLPDVVWTEADRRDLEALEDTYRQVGLDLARVRLY